MNSNIKFILKNTDAVCFRIKKTGPSSLKFSFYDGVGFTNAQGMDSLHTWDDTVTAKRYIQVWKQHIQKSLVYFSKTKPNQILPVLQPHCFVTGHFTFHFTQNSSNGASQFQKCTVLLKE